ncbi:MAG: hypothetical protein QW568_00250 [Candidatus Anstonellaceae archaeon]
MFFCNEKPYCKLFLLAAAAFVLLAGAPSAELVVNLFSPSSGAIYNNSTAITFQFNFTSNDSVANCTLYVNNSTPATIYSFSNATTNNNTLTSNVSTPFSFATSGVYTWYVSCVNATTGQQNTSATRTFISDGTIPSVASSFLVEPDSFFSPSDSAAGIILFNVTVTDFVTNVTRVRVDFGSAMNQSDVNMSINLTNYTALGNTSSWNGSFNVTALLSSSSVINSTSPVAPYSIRIYPYDQANNTVVGQPSSIEVLLHNLGAFQGPPQGNPVAACFREGTGSTNFSQVNNFNAVNLVMIGEMNGSQSCGYAVTGVNRSMPWGDTYKRMGMFNFSSVNLSTRENAQNIMSAMGRLIQFNIAPPRSFTPSRIFVNTTNLSALNNTFTQITLYDLPFGSAPNITYDENASATVNFSWSQGPYNSTFGFYVGNLTINVSVFSGYNISDSVVPSITLTSPVANANSTNTTVTINVSANGTGTEISNLIINITNSSGASVNSTQFNLTQDSTVDVNTASCTNTSAGYENIVCTYTVSLPANMRYTMTVTAYDYGTPPAGNNASSQRNFTIDTTAPSITLNSPANNTQTTRNWTVFNFTPTDNIYSAVNCTLTVMAFNSTPQTFSTTFNTSTNSTASNNTATTFNITSMTNNIYSWYVFCRDPAGNNVTSATSYLLVDTTNTSAILNATTNVTANQSVVVTNSSPSANITMANGTTNVTLNVSAVYNSTTFNATITNAITVNATTSLGAVVVQIPNGTTFTGASDWSGSLNLQYVTTSYTSPTNTGTNTVYGAVEIGLPSSALNLSRAVRILIPGAAGKLAGYSRGGTFTQITAACSADTQAVGDALSAGADCKIDSGSDLVIWTKHFTAFIAYANTPPSTTSPTSSGNNGGGNVVGGGGTPGSGSSASEIAVATDDGRSCTVSLGREISSTNSLSVITNTLTNNGGEECGFADFVFSDTFPSNFPSGMNEITFSPAYSSLEGYKATFSFPSFAPGESKTVTYSVNKWVPPSRLNNFTLAAFFAAKKAAAAPTTQPPTAPAPTVCGNGKLESGEECDATSCGTGKRCNLATCKCVSAPVEPSAPVQQEPAAPTAPQQGGLEWLGFAALGVGVLVVLAAIFFLAGKKRKGLGGV